MKQKNKERALLMVFIFILICAVCSCQVTQEKIIVKESDSSSCTKLTDSVLALADNFKERYKTQQRDHQTSYNNLRRQFYNNKSVQELTRKQLEELVERNNELETISIRIKDSVIYKYDTVEMTIYVRDTYRFVDTINYTYDFFFNALKGDTILKRKYKRMGRNKFKLSVEELNNN